MCIRDRLNGRELPDSILRRHDLTYRLFSRGARSPYGYIFEYRLGPDSYPAKGRNVVRVTLLQQDPKLDLPREVHDVDCSIQYRLHRDFEPPPVDY